MMFARARRGMSPAACVATAMLATVGAVSLWFMAKEKFCAAKSRLKEFGCECAKAVEDVASDLKENMEE